MQSGQAQHLLVIYAVALTAAPNARQSPRVPMLMLERGPPRLGGERPSEFQEGTKARL